MKIQLIRNATLKIWFGGKCFLVDPYFADRHSQPSFAGHSANPTVDLPLSISEILSGVDYVLISHLHPDHFDEEAQKTLPKHIPIFCQPEDETTIRNFGFQNVTAVTKTIWLNTIALKRTEGEHGEGAIRNLMGTVSGFLLQHPKEKTVYWTGDTIWCEPVQRIIFDYSPEIIVCHAGGNRFFKNHPIFGDALLEDSGPVIMNCEQVIELCYFAVNSKVLATHLGALDHETVTREELRNKSRAMGISSNQLIVPWDGQLYEF